MNDRKITRWGFRYPANIHKQQTAAQVGHFNGPDLPPTSAELRSLKRIKAARA